jgi:hypothetical protein
MSERVLEVYMAFDNREKELWFVDAPEKLNRLMRSLSLKRSMTLPDLKASVYDSERDRQDCVVDVEGWVYRTKRVQTFDKGLFALAPLPAPIDPELPLSVVDSRAN